MAVDRITAMIPTMTDGLPPLLALQSPVPPPGTTEPAASEPPPGADRPPSAGFADLLTEMATLVVVGVSVVGVVVVRRLMTVRSRQLLPGLPRERVLRRSRHGTLHDPKYLGSILQGEDPPSGP
ncbi:hypothetical protein [Synechococcus sp. CCY 9618]|uniref:hypothetical protein n=1 Tax=Synechococcus sp. CCY 9618 TaxID=2815602 RepID=UPI001C238404|nr:hypothetical protein [Synechococcus sp. CCY 9618]